MKISKTRLQQMIKEEIGKVLNETQDPWRFMDQQLAREKETAQAAIGHEERVASGEFATCVRADGHWGGPGFYIMEGTGYYDGPYETEEEAAQCQAKNLGIGDL